MTTAQLKKEFKQVGGHSFSDDKLSKLIGANDPIIREAISVYVRRQSPVDLPKISSSAEAYELLKNNFFDLSVEHFYTIYLNRANRVIGVKKISEGGVSGTVADPKVILKEALLLNASCLILAHNHPSGNMRPSESDLHLTRKLKTAATAMDMSVLDHLIISTGTFYSFADEGQI